MAYDLIPNRLFSFPSLQVPSLWDDSEWFNTQGSTTGVSISEDAEKIYVETALPGIDPKDVEMTFHDGYLWIRGEAKEEEENKKRKYYRQASKSFSYRISVPGEVDNATDPKASYKHGVMTVTFMKSPEAQPKKIQVSVSDEPEEKK